MNCRISTPASLADLLRAAFCSSEKLVGIVRTAALTCFPRKSEADDARRRIWRVMISETESVEGESEVVSWMEKATVESCF